MPKTIMKNHSGTSDLPRGTTQYIVGRGHKIVCKPQAAIRYARRYNMTFISPIAYHSLYKAT